jgi:hypothetical protein
MAAIKEAIEFKPLEAKSADRDRELEGQIGSEESRDEYTGKQICYSVRGYPSACLSWRENTRILRSFRKGRARI